LSRETFICGWRCSSILSGLNVRKHQVNGESYQLAEALLISTVYLGFIVEMFLSKRQIFIACILRWNISESPSFITL
jgi:hypothetical protein